MSVKQFYLTLLLSFICVAWADIDSTVDVAIKSEVQNVTEDIFHLANTCVSDKDCHHLGRCEEGVGGKFCKCKNGTSGYFCEKVDECVDNPTKCGTLDDVSCVFDEEREMAVCKCDNESKTYVKYRKKCISPCKTYSDCGMNGYCMIEVGDEKICACVMGVSGDYCEIIDQCHSKVVDCGEDNNATCTVGAKGKAYCKCDDKTKGFDYDEKICKGCEGCGENVYSAGGCTYKDGIRECYCTIRYYSSKEGKCEDCKCGQDSHGCKFENGTKICECWSGAANKDGFCHKCDCGPSSGVSECEFKNGKKVCTCKDGYALGGTNGTCKQMCNATYPCRNGGKCFQNLCSCLKGTSGDFCETIDECKGREKCGSAVCAYNVSSQEAYCKCENSLTFDDYNKMCKLCSCGSYANSCKFVEGKKICNCTDSYEDRRGTCTLCFCKGYSSTYGCKFDNYGDMKCKCLKGYAQVGDECKECDCGVHGKCSLTRWGSKSCTCDFGYTETNGMCKECDCGDHGKCVLTSWGTKLSCTCDEGYTELNRMCKECDCGKSGGCSFDLYGTKMCYCKSGYREFEGTCKACDCGWKATCELDKYGAKQCTCQTNYTMKDGVCTQIDECENSTACPHWTTKCVNTPGGYVCVCKDGYEKKGLSDDIKRDGCIEIYRCTSYTCNDVDAICVNTPGSYRCECPSGYLHRSSVEKRNVCMAGGSDIRPWRTGSIVVGVISAIIIIGLIIAIAKRYSS